MKYAFVEKNRRQYGVPALCEALQASTGTPVPRSVITAARDLQRFAQRRYAVLPSILLNERVLHFASRAK